MEEVDLQDLVFGEGWPIDILDPSQRNQLAFRTLEKLKVIEDKKKNRLELYNHPESKLLIITLQTAIGRSEKPLGTVEINEFLTLSDLRILLAHELDRERMPRSYQFLYKGSQCAIRQESMRRAWDTLPKCTLIQRKGNEPEKEKNNETTNADLASKTDVQSSNNASTLNDTLSRRVSNRLVPIPIPSLARIQEETGVVHLLHERKNFIKQGDIIRIGNIKGRDYTVSFMDAKTSLAFPYMFIIEPAFSMVSELDFETPTTGNMPYPKISSLDMRMRKYFPKTPKVNHRFYTIVLLIIN